MSKRKYPLYAVYDTEDNGICIMQGTSSYISKKLGVTQSSIVKSSHNENLIGGQYEIRNITEFDEEE